MPRYRHPLRCSTELGERGRAGRSKPSTRDVHICRRAHRDRSKSDILIKVVYFRRCEQLFILVKGFYILVVIFGLCCKQLGIEIVGCGCVSFIGIGEAAITPADGVADSREAGAKDDRKYPVSGVK